MPFRNVFDPSPNLIRSLDPRARLIGLAAFAPVVALLSDFPPLFIALTASAGMVLLARPRPIPFLRRFLAANAFIAFLWMFLPWSVAGGESLFRIGSVNVTKAGVRLSILITLKSNTILLATAALAGTSPTHQIVRAMRRLGLPKRLATMIFITIDYIRIIDDERHRLWQAAAVRGFHPRTNLSTYRVYADFLGSLLVRSYERGERVYQAMACRGFSGDFPVLDEREWRGGDMMACAVLLVCAAIPAAMQWLPIF